MTPEQKLEYQKLRAMSPKSHDKVFEALGWMHAECISMIETGMHPAAADVAKLVSDARRDLKLDESSDTIPMPQDCDYARKMILVASEYLKAQGEDPGPIPVSVETAERMMATLDRADMNRQLKGNPDFKMLLDTAQDLINHTPDDRRWSYWPYRNQLALAIDQVLEGLK